MWGVKLSLTAIITVLGIHSCTSNAAPPQAPAKATSNRVEATKASKRLIAQIKAQALKEARAQLIKEDEIKAKARLEAIQEMSGEVIDEPQTAEVAE